MEDNNTELEEGEACYYKDDDDDSNDLDSLSYIVRAYSNIVLNKFYVFSLLNLLWFSSLDDDDDDECNFNHCIVIGHGISMYQCICFHRETIWIEKVIEFLMIKLLFKGSKIGKFL